MSEATNEAEHKGIPTPAELGFDPAELRQKYAAERDKRLRADGNNQYQEITGALEHYNADPYVDPGFTRPALHEQLDALIIGGGFGGMLAAARLQKAGITNIRIIEKAGDFGGTWYWNRYPGAQCDIESYVYLPLLEETGYIPKEKYSFAPEIFAHAQRIGKHFNLYEKACFQTQIKEARWSDDDRRWTVKTDRGDVFKRALRHHVERAAESAQAPRDSRNREIQRAHLPYQPLGLRLHRRRYHRRHAQARRQARRVSSGPARPRFRACRILANTPSSSTSFSARRPRSTNAATSLPIRNG